MLWELDDLCQINTFPCLLIELTIELCKKFVALCGFLALVWWGAPDPG